MNALPYLDREAFDYAFAALDAGGPLAEACRAVELPFEPLPHRGVLDPRSARALRRRLIEQRIDLVHAHLPLVGTLARLAARGLATRVVYTEHNTPAGYRLGSRWLNAATWAWQQEVLAVSEEVRRRAPGASDQIAVVPNGLDFESLDREAAVRPAAYPLPARGALTVLVPASLAPRKGQDVLLAALARMAALPPLHVMLAGEGAFRDALVNQITRLGLGERVHLLGHRADVPALCA